MTNGFLDDLPDLNLPGKRRKKKPAESSAESSDQVVRYVRPRCPKCNHANCPVYSSRDLPIRHHKCARCGHTFKSIEENYQPENDS
jgi:DNA-directed RNA polymerase subunit RPC12/RpoP